MAIRIGHGRGVTFARDYKYGRRTRMGRFIGPKPKCDHVSFRKLDVMPARMKPKNHRRSVPKIPKRSAKNPRALYVFRWEHEFVKKECDRCACTCYTTANYYSDSSQIEDFSTDICDFCRGRMYVKTRLARAEYGKTPTAKEEATVNKASADLFSLDDTYITEAVEARMAREVGYVPDAEPDFECECWYKPVKDKDGQIMGWNQERCDACSARVYAKRRKMGEIIEKQQAEGYY